MKLFEIHYKMLIREESESQDSVIVSKMKMKSNNNMLSLLHKQLELLRNMVIALIIFL